MTPSGLQFRRIDLFSNLRRAMYLCTQVPKYRGTEVPKYRWHGNKPGNFSRLESLKLSLWSFAHTCKTHARSQLDRQERSDVSDLALHDTNESNIAARCIDAAWEATAVAAVSIVTMEDHNTCNWTAPRDRDSFLLLHKCPTTQRQRTR